MPGTIRHVGPVADLASLALMIGENQPFTATDLEAHAQLMNSGVVLRRDEVTDGDLVSLARALA